MCYDDAVPAPAAHLVDRFRRDFEALLDCPLGESRLAIAVSGGPDSLALLLLAAAAYPNQVVAATVDHGLRASSADEAALVERHCTALGVPHRTLRPDVPLDTPENLQERARNMRYRLLGRWAGSVGAAYLLTAHHADDQAETFLMRAARGSGIAGLASIRAVSLGVTRFFWPEDLAALGEEHPVIVRPLLGWRKASLRAIVENAGIAYVSDPSNEDGRYDRTRFRALLDANGWLAPDRLARSVSNLAEGEEALDQLARMFYDERVRLGEADEVRFDPAGLPREIKRRMTWMALNRARLVLGMVPDWRGGEDVEGLLRTLEEGGTGTLAGVMASGGNVWWFREAPPRRA